MAKKKILFINQEISPYVPDTNLSLMGKDLPQATPDQEAEIAEEVRKEVNYRFGTEPGEKLQEEKEENTPDEDQNQVLQ